MDIEKNYRTALFYLRLLLVFALFSAAVPSALAKHLVGGSITYSFIQVNNNIYTYQITVDVFRDCSDPTGAQLDPTINVGIYEHTSTGPRQLFKTEVFSLTSTTSVNPISGGSNCSFKPSTCLEHGVYIWTIDLPASSYGYDLIYLRCCRNTMVNLPLNSGYDYYGFIPPTALKNNSPTFNNVPVPYICANDTVTLDFSASEPDGDSVTYKVAWPYSGGSSIDVVPSPPNIFTSPDYVSYNSGYSYIYPFGIKGICKIGKTTGLLTVYAVKAGNYAVAVDYFEYRNGVLIDSIRRDVQFIVLSCPYNPAPERQAIAGSTATDYYVEAGKTLNFNFAFTDPNDDGIKLTASGTIFTKKTNPAKLTILAQKDTFQVTANVNWKTLCSDGSSKPYSFNVKVQDNGCPPKVTYQTLNIYVTPPIGPNNIFGAKTACGLGDTFTYSAIPVTGMKFLWKAVNGKIVGSANGDSARIIWNNNITQGIVKVVGINASGCPSDTFSIKVKIFTKPPKPVINGPTMTCANVPTVFWVIQTGYKSTIWVYGNATLIKNNGPNISLKWTKQGGGAVRAVLQDTNGCYSDTLQISVDVFAPGKDTIYGPSTICPNTKDVVYMSNNTKGSTYLWQISGGVQTAGGNTGQIKVNWGNKGTGIVKVRETTAFGCKGDTDSLLVKIDYHLITPPITGDTNICEFSKGKIYQAINVAHATYLWSVSGGNIISGQNTNKIIVDWGGAGTGKITMQQMGYDSVNKLACAGNIESVFIKLKPSIREKPIHARDSACLNTVVSFYVNGVLPHKYIWKLSDTTFAINNQGNDSVWIFFNKPGTYIMTVTEISDDSCSGSSLQKIIHILGNPDTSGIKGPVLLCAPNSKNQIYTITGPANSTYNWKIIGGNIRSGNGSRHILVDWNDTGKGHLSVIETNILGCQGPENKLTVSIDSVFIKMDLVTTEKQNDNIIQVYWHIFNPAHITGKVNIYRSINPTHDGYRLLASVPTTDTMYTDKAVSTHGSAYYYKVSAENPCGNIIWSSIHRSILLTESTINDSTIFLDWNRYHWWPEGVDLYNNWLSADYDTILKLMTFTQDSTSIVYTDLLGYHQCYRIGAVQRGTKPLISWSNDVCIDLDPILWVPNAFTPNNDPVNNDFHVFVRNYKTYRIDIYNRWGEHIYTSNDPTKPWDGRFKGANCMEGVYLYMINVGGAKKNIYKSGTITLMR